MSHLFSRVREYLRDRKLATGITVLALAAGTLQAVFWWIAPTPSTNDFVGPPRSGYTLSNFRMWSYDPQGRLGFTMRAPRLDRREGDDSLYITSPRFTLAAKQPGVPDWQGNSLYGWVNHAGTLLKLQGPVHMYRPAYGDALPATLDTSDVTAWPKENRMETAAPAQMTQGASRMSGVGMRAELTDNHLELLHDVHGTFVPHPRPAASRRAGAGSAHPAASPRTEG
ncbi:LPS export ABC transporter periplasmic protein LptC [Dyella sp. A6]|uniref:LPS export ABC transporter periplasmic protein LptC n=1 Tax=Dyella aluminiiresistens TaxID=3069105 RepID=UPI002E77D48F|nr:LPS export ABC transporter periplasmic protein LptC [Dyella sp. A6]